MTRKAFLAIAFLLMLLAGASSAQYDDYIRVGVDSIPAGSSNFEIRFYWQNSCEGGFMGLSQGFEFTLSGDASYSYVGFEKNPATDWFDLGGLICDASQMDGVSPDYLLMGASWLTGFGPFDETWMFSVFVDVGEGEGQICIDSMLPWEWNELGCDGPYFLDKYGSDANHPICITVYEDPCNDADCSGAHDIDDVVYLLDYIFSGGPSPHGNPDCLESVDIDDAVYLINYIFAGGPPPCIPGEPTVITGTVDWPGHQLTNPIVFVDTCHNPTLIVPLDGIGFDANANGDFTMTYDLDGPIEGVITGWDDLDGDWTLEAGEPWGRWDANGDGYWTKADMVPLVPGQTLNGAEVSLQFMIIANSPSTEVRLMDVKTSR
ncbi:MAG: hypothetical protein KKG33_09400 [candidate division Zixibacteria bacterium]|nr:hypothetical protein [candidate division Zixibacteria bacterium]MBU1471181.1 hypothetical protein [candidate division Zixibacteria bacterium]MBU2625762.1 hypothetical protein [candidate division Zixibacteria bacterium]